MEPQDKKSLKIFVTGAATELGDETVRVLVGRGHQVSGLADDEKKLGTIRAAGGQPIRGNLSSSALFQTILETARPDVLLHLEPQVANSLLHDGHDWQNYDQYLPDSTRILLQGCEGAGVGFLVYPSYAFLYGNARNATESTPRTAPAADPIFVAALQAEDSIIRAATPAAVLRLGYLYGPQSENLKKYVQSYRIFRPYWSGPGGRLTNWLHFADAATALALAVENQPAGQAFNVVDGSPVGFSEVMDTLGLLTVNRRPFHIPTWAEIPARLTIRSQQQELLKLSTTVNSDKFRQTFGWSPRYPSYKQGLDQVLETWRATGVRV